MEFFSEGKAVRLRSHLGKYLFACDDEETVRQSRNASSHKVRWTVEVAEGHSHVIRLRSYSGKYLSASDEPFLLGVTGRKVILVLADPSPRANCERCIEWEPIREGMFVMMRAKWGGKFLRANGGTPPWKNSVTHDVPNRTATQDWVLWEAEMVDVEEESVKGYISPASSFSSNSEDADLSLECFESGSGSPHVNGKVGASGSLHSSIFQFGSHEGSGMEIFRNAKVVRLRSHHGKYLWADKEKDGVSQERNGKGNNAEWTVEIIQNANAVRFKSCYGKYLTASNMSFLLGSTGKKVVQSVPKRLDSSVEWEPMSEGAQVKLMSRSGHYLRANGGLPPWRNSVTHDIPQRTATRDWILWDVYVAQK